MLIKAENVKRIFSLIVSIIVLSSFATAQDSKTADGTIIESEPCAKLPKRTYEQYLVQQKTSFEQEVKDAERDGYKATYFSNFNQFVLSKEEFDRREAFTNYDCQKIKYMSDGLKVVGFIWKPKIISEKKLPVVIVNRGGNSNQSNLTPQSFYYPYVTNGFVVIGSQYRGADGGEGKDEYGGADVNDVLNLVPLARSLGYVDMNNIFMHGASRGAMQAFVALKKGMQVNAVAVVGALTDMTAAAKERPGVSERVWSKLIPEFAEKKADVLHERSAVEFANQINVPVIILHGGADWRSNVGSQSLALASKLQSLGKTYELHVYAGDDHPISINRLDREVRIIEWFRKFMK